MDTNVKMIKIQSQEGLFNSSQKKLTFSIPEGHHLNLSKCSLLINARIDTVDVNSTPDDTVTAQFDGRKSIYNTAVFIQDSGDSLDMLPTQCLIRHANFKSSQDGYLEQLQRVDAYNACVKQYTESFSDKRSSQHLGLGGVDDINNNGVSGFRQLITLGDSTVNNSREVESNIIVPLKDVFDLCRVDSYSTSQRGQTEISLEMNWDKMVIHGYGLRDDGYWTNHPQSFGLDIPVPTPSAEVTLSSITIMKPVTAGGAAPDIPKLSNFERDCLYYVGQKVQIALNTFTAATAVPAKTFTFAAGDFRERTIAKIENVGGRPKLTFETPIVVIASGDTVSGIRLRGADLNLATPANKITINKCELELYDRGDAPKKGKLQYATYDLEQDQVSSQTLNKQYIMNGAHDNFFFANCPSSSPRTKINSYRFYMDNEPYNSTVVSARTQVHYDNIKKLFINMNLPLKNISEYAYHSDVNPRSNPDANHSRGIIGMPLPVSNQQKIISIECTANANMQNIMLFKRRVKVV